MIAPAQPQTAQGLCRNYEDQFLEMMPLIQRQARLAFRRLHPDHREDMIQEATCNAYCTFARLVRRGKAHLAFASPLANYAIRQAIAGRRVGTRLNNRDITSPHARLVHGIILERLNKFDPERGGWLEALLEDRRATPADIAAARIDVAAWFNSLPSRNRRIAVTLAMGETTRGAARRFGLSKARISQLREVLRESWERFQSGCSVALQV